MNQTIADRASRQDFSLNHPTDMVELLSDRATAWQEYGMPLRLSRAEIETMGLDRAARSKSATSLRSIEAKIRRERLTLSNTISHSSPVSFNIAFSFGSLRCLFEGGEFAIVASLRVGRRDEVVVEADIALPAEPTEQEGMSSHYF